MFWGRAVVDRAVVGGLLAVAAVAVAGAGCLGCRKETMVVADGGTPSTVMPGGAAGADPRSRSLGKDRSESAAAERYVVRLERSECYGVCPAYAVEIGGDGAVEYDGKAFVAARGRVSTRVDRAAVASLLERFDRAGFFRLEWEDPCNRMATDNPTSTLTLVHGGRKRTIADYHGNECMPPVLRELEDEVDRVAQTTRWVKCDAGYCGE